MYFIPVLLLMSMNIEITFNEMIYVVSLSSLNYTFMSYIPTPGASLGAEFGFQTLLLTISNVTSNIAVTVVLLWRLFTYYLSMLYGFICYLVLEKRLKNLDVVCDIKNEARVHIWYNPKYGTNREPYISLEDAFSSHNRDRIVKEIISNELQRCNCDTEVKSFRQMVKGHLDIFAT